MRDIEQNIEKYSSKDTRIKTLIESLPSMASAQVIENSGEIQNLKNMTPALISLLSRQHFPLCMSEVSFTKINLIFEDAR